MVMLLAVVGLSQECTGCSHFLIVRPTFLGFIPCVKQRPCAGSFLSLPAVSTGEMIFFLNGLGAECQVDKERRNFVYCS